MTLLVTLFLVLTNIFNNIPATSPKVDGFSALTVWVLSCILFVFGALVGYAGILFRKMFVNKVIFLSSCLKIDYVILIFSPFGATLFQVVFIFQVCVKVAQSTIAKCNTKSMPNIDAVFLIAFPILFVLFNIVYWRSFEY